MVTVRIPVHLISDLIITYLNVMITENLCGHFNKVKKVDLLFTHASVYMHVCMYKYDADTTSVHDLPLRVALPKEWIAILVLRTSPQGCF